MKYLILVFMLGLVFTSNAQQWSEEGIVSLLPKQGQEHNIALYKGDTLELKATVNTPRKGKIGLIQLKDQDNGLILEAVKVKKYDVSIVVKKKGVYTLWIQNNDKKSNSYKVSYLIKSSTKRKPLIGYKHKRDTIYGFSITQNRNNIKKEIVNGQEEHFYLNSASNALLKGGKNNILMPIQLPENTIEWFYSFTASREKKEMETTMASFSLASKLSKYADEDQNIQQAISKLSPPPGAHICHIYLLNSTKEATAFKENEEFNYDLEASRENFKSGLVSVKNSRKAFLGIKNPDNLYGIHIGISITAVVATKEKGTELVQIPIITSYKSAYIKEK